MHIRVQRIWLFFIENEEQRPCFFFKSKKVQKNAEFHADFKSVGKFLINALKKSYKPNKFDEFEKKINF